MLVGRRLAGMPAMGWPSTAIVPPVGLSKPAIMRSSVVLPQPDGPSREKNSPSPIVTVASSSALKAP